MWSLFRRNARPAKPARRTPHSYRPCLEALEDRCLLTAGALDPTFNPAGSPAGTFAGALKGSVSDVLVQPSGNIVLAGTTYNSKGDSVFGAAELNSIGGLVSSFGSKGTVIPSFTGKWRPSSPSDATLYPTGSPGDEKILEAGSAANSSWSQPGAFALVRYNANGSLDTSFGSGGLVTTSFPQGSAGPVGVFLVPNGSSLPKILAVGAVGGQGFAFARYNPNGSLDTTFGSSGTLYIPFSEDAEAAALDPVNGDLIVVGEGGPNASEGQLNAFKPTYNAQGSVIGYSLDSSFGGSGTVYNDSFYLLRGLAIQSDGNIVVAGETPTNTPVQNSDTFEVARYNMNGTLDTTFNGTGEESTWFPNSIGSYAAKVAIQSDGKLVVGGNNATGSSHQFALVRYNSDGSLDTSFGTGGMVTTSIGSTSASYGLTLQPNGEILAAGYSGQSQWAVARYLASEPEIGSLTANPNPVTAGSSVTLTASNITDSNPGVSITQVAFYLDSNNDGTLEPGTDTLLGYATQTSPGVWSLTDASAFGLTAGTYTLFGQAEDSDGVFGDPIALTLTVQ